MNLSASLQITPKGVDEVKNRIYKLSIKKRSVLILLECPQSIDYILKKTVFHRDEILEEISGLVDGGFVSVVAGEVPRPAASSPATVAGSGPVTVTPSSGGAFYLKEDIILSEAKFLLTDFCVDCFGTQSQSFVDEISESKNVKSLLHCLRSIHATTERQCPQQLSVLQDVVREINETA